MLYMYLVDIFVVAITLLGCVLLVFFCAAFGKEVEGDSIYSESEKLTVFPITTEKKHSA